MCAWGGNTREARQQREMHIPSATQHPVFQPPQTSAQDTVTHLGLFLALGEFGTPRGWGRRWHGRWYRHGRWLGSGGRVWFAVDVAGIPLDLGLIESRLHHGGQNGCGTDTRLAEVAKLGVAGGAGSERIGCARVTRRLRGGCLLLLLLFL